MFLDGSVDRQCEDEYEQLQRMNSGAYGDANYQQESEGRGDRAPKKKQKAHLYDRIDAQWLVIAEVGFVLTTFGSVCTFICFLRVFGAGILAGSVGLIAVLAGMIVLICFWRELSASEYKFRVMFCLFAMGCGLALSMSDQAVDMTRHYWAVLQAATMTAGVTTLVAGALVMAIKNNSTKGE